MVKNILFISPTGTLDNGAEISIVNLMSLLVEQGYGVINCIPDYGVESQKEYKNTLSKKGIKTLSLPAVKWWWEEAPGGNPGTESERQAAYKENIAQIRAIIIQEKIDLVVTNTVNMFQGAMAASLETVAHFWLIHEFPYGEFGYYASKFSFIESMSDDIFAVTGSLQEELSLRSNKTIYPFIPYTEIKSSPLLKGEKVRFVSIGRLTKRKNQLELLRAYHRLGVDAPDLVFIGAWDEDYKILCDRYIEDKGLKNVYFKGYSENPWKEVTDMDIAVFPSSLETFGLVYIESVLNGVPTILSDNPGHLSAYQVMQEGVLYPKGNVEILAKNLKDAMKNFTSLKKNAFRNKIELQKKYGLKESYGLFLKEVENSEKRKSMDLQPLHFLFEETKRISKVKKVIRRLFQLKK